MIKYILIGGQGLDKNGKKRYIEPRELPELYSIKQNECITLGHEWPIEMTPYDNMQRENTISLRPMDDGNYCLGRVLERRIIDRKGSMVRELKEGLEDANARADKYQQLFFITLSALAVGLSLAFYF